MTTVRSAKGLRALILAAIVGAACRGAEAPRVTETADAATDAGAPPKVVDETDAGAPAGGQAPARLDAAAPPAIDPAGEPGMILVPGGSFTMGTDDGGQGDERPAHAVTVASFFLDRTEVTQSAYAECVDQSACKPPDPSAINKFGGVFRGPNRPVVGVSWFDAKAYCTFRKKRLPREAEFERAVRGADGRRFPWGNEPPTPARAIYSTNHTEDVGSRPDGRGPYGHDDLAGNVWEWLEDEYDPYAYRRATADRGIPGDCDAITAAQNELRATRKQGFTGTNPIPTECERAIRGGAYNYDPAGLRSTNRVHHPARFKLVMTGLRCAKDASGSP